MKKENTYKIEAVVLRSFESREYDRVYTIFSKEQGKMCVLGIGTRKPVAKLASGLEPLTKSEVFLVRGRKLDRVKGVIIHEQHPALRKNLALLADAKRTARIIEGLAGEDQVGEGIYELFGEYLGFLNKLAKKIEVGGEFDSLLSSAKLLQLALIWRVVQWEGHEPKLFHCAGCNSNLVDQDRFLLAFPDGVLCGNCRAAADSSCASVSKDTVKLLRVFLCNESQMILKIRCSLGALKQVNLMTKMMVENLIGRRVQL